MTTDSRADSTSAVKILLILRNGGLRGGTEVQANRHLSEMNSIGISCQLLTMRPFRLIRFSSISGSESLTGVRALIGLLRVLGQRPILQMYVSRLHLVKVLLFCALPGTAHLVSYRSGQKPRPPSGPFKRLAGRVLGQVDMVTANSLHICKEFKIRYPNKQVQFVPNYPSITDAPRIEAREPWVCSSTLGPILVAVGNLRQVKDHKTLLAAMAILQERGLTPTGVVYGSGPTLMLLQHFRDLWALDIQFPGFRSDWKDIVDPQSIFVHCSITEGFSNSLVEAAARGLPILAAKSPSAIELLGDSVGLFPVGGAIELADLVEEAYRSPVLRAKLTAESRLISDMVNSVNPAEQWKRVYRSLQVRSGQDHNGT